MSSTTAGAAAPIDAARTPADRRHINRLGLLVALGGITMLFAAFTSAYIVRSGGGDWAALEKDDRRDAAILNGRLEPLREFVLPGGGRAAAAAHVARTVVRRAERAWWRAAEDAPALADTGAGVFLNRLADYLFVLARTLARNEVLWTPLADPRQSQGE